MSSVEQKQPVPFPERLRIEFGKKLVALLGVGIAAMPILSMIAEKNLNGLPVLLFSVPAGILTIAMANSIPNPESR